MKKIFLLILSTLSINAISQNEEQIQKLAQSTCACISEKNLEGKSREEVELQFGFCILGSVSENKKEFDQIYKGKSVAEIDMESFGGEVGIQMAILCPQVFMNLDLGLTDDSSAEVEVELGKITSIEKKQFNLVNLEIADGSVLKFLWLWDFEGSEILTKNQFKDKWMNILYTIIPLYDPERKTYINYKVIEGIELGE